MEQASGRLSPLSRRYGVPAASALVAAQAARMLVRQGLAGPLVMRVCILAVRSVTPLAMLLTCRNLLGMLRNASARRAKRLLLAATSVWALAETVFFVYMDSCRRYLNGQTNRKWQAVAAHSTPEKRKRSLERYLLSLAQVCKSHTADPNSPDRGRRPKEMQGFVQRAGSARVLRSTSDGRMASKSNLLGLGGREQSINDMLQMWEGSSDITDDDLRLVKWTELASFFRGPGRGEAEDIHSWLRRGNVEDWLAHYWFRGTSTEELEQRCPNERAELAGLVDLALDNMGLADLPQGRNAGVSPCLLLKDPLNVLHRPLVLYFGSSVVCPLLTRQVMRLLGFHKERIGGLSYWHRPPKSGVDVAVDISGAMQTPMVVVHGLGVGLVPYYVFVARLARRHSGEIFVPEFPFLATHPWLNVPSAREIVAQLTDMIKAHGHTAAHFTGHSFGAVVVGWVMKMSPNSVLCITLLDPACFLMMRSENIVQLALRSCNAFEMLCQYFCFQEVFTMNLLCRNLFWEQSTLWPEDLRMPSVIEISSEDHVVQGVFLRRLLDHERRERKQRRHHGQRRPRSSVDIAGAKPLCEEQIDIQWCEGYMHGGILYSTRLQDKLFVKMRSMAHAIYAESPRRS